MFHVKQYERLRLTAAPLMLLIFNSMSHSYRNYHNRL